MKFLFSSIKHKITSGYSPTDESMNLEKSTNINILLNRVELDKKRENRKKLLFTAVTSLGVVLFGVLIF